MSTTVENVLNFTESTSLSDEELDTQTKYIHSSATYHPADVNTEDIMSIIEASGTLDFWNSPEEDRYSE
ncbi:MAG: hypothetical protein V2A79_02995 [Planctomycetota bacterium]